MVTAHLSSDWISSLISTLALYFFAMLMTATTEEIILRGYTLGNLAKLVNPHIAVFTTAFIFGYLHFKVSLIYGALAFLFGLVLGYGFIWTQNIYFCIGLHFSWNFIESCFFSQTLLNLVVNAPILSGAKNITPDREGLLSLPPTILGLFILVICKIRKRL